MSFETSLIKELQIEEQLVLTVSRNVHSERVYVQFKSADGKITLQKTFQDNFFGRKDAEKFEKSINSLAELKTYLRMK